jgi:hypothetical protein
MIVAGSRIQHADDIGIKPGAAYEVLALPNDEALTYSPLLQRKVVEERAGAAQELAGRQ